MRKLIVTSVMLRNDDQERCRAWGEKLNLSASAVVRVALDRLFQTKPPVGFAVNPDERPEGTDAAP